MFKQILVPVDFSEHNKMALKMALDLGEMSGGTIHLLHVIKLIEGDTYDEFADFYRKLEKQAQARMQELLASAATEKLPVKSHIVVGHRVQEILFFAEENGVDLILMNSHKIDPDNPDAGWGTISQKVGILAQCPILLVK